MPLVGQPPAGVGKYTVPDPGEFHEIFAVSRIVDGVGLCLGHIHLRAVQPGAQFTGKQECPGHANGTDGIQLVCIEQHPGLHGPRGGSPAKPVGGDAVDDVLPAFVGQGPGAQHLPGHGGTFFRVAERAVGPVLVPTADVVKVGGGLRDQQVRTFGRADASAKPVYPQGVVPVVAPLGLGEVCPGQFPDACQDRGGGFGHDSCIAGLGVLGSHAGGRPTGRVFKAAAITFTSRLIRRT